MNFGILTYLVKETLCSTQPDWTHFWILRANLTCLNPKIGPVKRVGFGRTNVDECTRSSLMHLHKETQ